MKICGSDGVSFHMVSHAATVRRAIVKASASVFPRRTPWLKKASPKYVHLRPLAHPNDVRDDDALVTIIVSSSARIGTKTPE